MHAFQVTSADASVRADFSEAMLDLLLPAKSVSLGLLHNLAPFEVRAGDVRFDQGNGSLGEVGVSCSLMSLHSSIMIRAEKLELQVFDLFRTDLRKLETAFLASLEAVSAAAGRAPFRSYSLAVSLHGRLSNLSTEAFLTKLSSPHPGGLGPPAGSGVVHYFGATGNRLAASVTLDKSASIDGGLFCRLFGLWDAQLLRHSEFSSTLIGFAQQALSAFELEAKRD
jgi:hypothetical protein